MKWSLVYLIPPNKYLPDGLTHGVTDYLVRVIILGDPKQGFQHWSRVPPRELTSRRGALHLADVLIAKQSQQVLNLSFTHVERRARGRV